MLHLTILFIKLVLGNSKILVQKLELVNILSDEAAALSGDNDPGCGEDTFSRDAEALLFQRNTSWKVSRTSTTVCVACS